MFRPVQVPSRIPKATPIRCAQPFRAPSVPLANSNGASNSHRRDLIDCVVATEDLLSRSHFSATDIIQQTYALRDEVQQTEAGHQSRAHADLQRTFENFLRYDQNPAAWEDSLRWRLRPTTINSKKGLAEATDDRGVHAMDVFGPSALGNPPARAHPLLSRGRGRSLRANRRGDREARWQRRNISQGSCGVSASTQESASAG